MRNPIVYTFRPIKGRWICISYAYDMTLDDALCFLGLTIDDDCQFCRIIRNGTIYEYRHYNNSKITLTVYEQDS